jgi:hypothetical protein
MHGIIIKLCDFVRKKQLYNSQLFKEDLKDTRVYDDTVFPTLLFTSAEPILTVDTGVSSLDIYKVHEKLIFNSTSANKIS